MIIIDWTWRCTEPKVIGLPPRVASYLQGGDQGWESSINVLLLRSQCFVAVKSLKSARIGLSPVKESPCFGISMTKGVPNVPNSCARVVSDFVLVYPNLLIGH